MGIDRKYLEKVILSGDCNLLRLALNSLRRAHYYLLNEKDELGQTLLMIALNPHLSKPDPIIIQLLLSVKRLNGSPVIDLNTKSKQQQTALHFLFDYKYRYHPVSFLTIFDLFIKLKNHDDQPVLVLNESLQTFCLLSVIRMRHPFLLEQLLRAQSIYHQPLFNVNLMIDERSIVDMVAVYLHETNLRTLFETLISKYGGHPYYSLHYLVTTNDSVLLNSCTLALSQDELNAVNRLGNTALIVAAQHDNTAALKVLLKAGASTRPANFQNDTVFTILLKRKNWNGLRILIEYGSDFDVHSPAHRFLIEQLLNQSSNCQSMIINSIFTRSASKSDLFELKIILHRVINLNNIGMLFDLYLKAASNNQINLLELYTQFAKQKNLASNFRLNCLNESLLCAIEKGHHETTEWLLYHCADADYLQVTNLRPLHFAIKHINHLIVKQLLIFGATITSDNRHYISPIRYALRKNQITIIELMLNRALTYNINEMNCIGDSPFSLLEEAMYNGQATAAEHFLSHGAAVTCYALQLACMNDDITLRHTLIRMLVKHKIEPFQSDLYSISPLNILCSKHDLDGVKLLLPTLVFDASSYSHFGLLALISNPHQTLIELLLQAGANCLHRLPEGTLIIDKIFQSQFTAILMPIFIKHFIKKQHWHKLTLFLDANTKPYQLKIADFTYDELRKFEIFVHDNLIAHAHFFCHKDDLLLIQQLKVIERGLVNYLTPDLTAALEDILNVPYLLDAIIFGHPVTDLLTHIIDRYQQPENTAKIHLTAEMVFMLQELFNCVYMLELMIIPDMLPNGLLSQNKHDELTNLCEKAHSALLAPCNQFCRFDSLTNSNVICKTSEEKNIIVNVIKNSNNWATLFNQKQENPLLPNLETTHHHTPYCNHH